MELVNTALEAIVDLVCGRNRHALAKKAKDVAAGAVFCSLIVCGIGCICLILYKNRKKQYQHV